MKKLVIYLCIASLFACGNDVEKKATEKLEEARAAFQKGDYSATKLLVDSIKILYPKAYEVRREGLKLIQQAELKEQERSMVYLDSMLLVKQKEFETIKPRFTFEKDVEYQAIGNYLWPTQVVEKNLHRSYLRFQVNEKGVLVMTSIYCGKNNIHHNAVKVIAADKSFAETPPSRDSYETTNLGEKIEMADYRQGEDGSVMDFIYLNKDQTLRVEYKGERSYAFALSAADRKALVETYELSKTLSSIEQIKKEIEEAKLKIEFVTRKMQHTAEKEKAQ
mgnify:FL=1